MESSWRFGSYSLGLGTTGARLYARLLTPDAGWVLTSQRLPNGNAYLWIPPANVLTDAWTLTFVGTGGERSFPYHYPVTPDTHP